MTSSGGWPALSPPGSRFLISLQSFRWGDGWCWGRWGFLFCPEQAHSRMSRRRHRGKEDLENRMRRKERNKKKKRSRHVKETVENTPLWTENDLIKLKSLWTSSAVVLRRTCHGRRAWLIGNSHFSDKFYWHFRMLLKFCIKTVI